MQKVQPPDKIPERKILGKNHNAVQIKLSRRLENTGKVLKSDVNFKESQIQYIENQFDHLHTHAHKYTFSHTQMH